MTNLVIGQTGFIGSAIHSSLQETIKFKPKSWSQLDFKNEIEKLTHRNNLRVYWSAGISNNTSTQNQIEMEINLIRLFFELVTKNNLKIEQINFISSAGSIYSGYEDSFITSNSPTNPISIYGKSRLIIEDLFKSFTKSNDIKLNIFRLTNVFGLKKRFKLSSGVINNLINSNINRIPLNIFVSLFTKQDYIDIDFVAKNINFISSKYSKLNNKNEEVFILSRNQSHSIQEILSIISRITSRKTPFVMQQDPNSEIRNFSLNFNIDNDKYVKFKILPIEFQIRRLISDTINVKTA